MLNFFHKALRIKKVLIGRDFYQNRQRKKNTVSLGNRYADWTFCPDNINQDSIVYSFGVGTDISFDLEMIKLFGLHVFAFDPTPDSIDWIGKQELPVNFHFFPFGIAAIDGFMPFILPDESGITSLRISDSDLTKQNKLTLEVHKISTILNELVHHKIDILKMDIEGAEYAVVDDIITNSAEINQLLIEFHHRFKPYNVTDTKEAIRKLNQAGYFIFNISPNGEEYSFIKMK